MTPREGQPMHGIIRVVVLYVGVFAAVLAVGLLAGVIDLINI